MKNKSGNKKQGFTIIELVIVIAVIAILAAVLIPTFTSIVKKANLSSDQQAIANMNKITAAENILDEFEYPSDAVVALYANGWNKGKLSTYSAKHHYAYHKERNMFFLLDEDDNVIYPTADNTIKAGLWAFYTDSSTDKVSGVYNYIALGNIVSDEYFARVCSEEGKTYTVDLYNYVISVKKPESLTVKLLNGTNVSGDGGYTVDENSDVSVRVGATTVFDGHTGAFDSYTDYVEYTNSTEEEIARSVKIKNLFFDFKDNTTGKRTSDLIRNIIKNDESTGQGEFKTEVTFENCTLAMNGAMQVHNAWDSNCYVNSFSFENCTFIQNADNQYTLTFNVNVDTKQHRVSYSVNNCIIKSVGRGINVTMDGDNANPIGDCKINITNNTFDLPTEGGSNIAVQIAGGNFEKVSIDKAFIAISGNTISAHAAVRIHNGFIAQEGQPIEEIVNFANNKLIGETQTVVADPEEGKPEQNEKNKRYVEAFNKIFK